MLPHSAFDDLDILVALLHPFYATVPFLSCEACLSDRLLMITFGFQRSPTLLSTDTGLFSALLFVQFCFVLLFTSSVGGCVDGLIFYYHTLYHEPSTIVNRRD